MKRTFAPPSGRPSPVDGARPRGAALRMGLLALPLAAAATMAAQGSPVVHGPIDARAGMEAAFAALARPAADLPSLDGRLTSIVTLRP